MDGIVEIDVVQPQDVQRNVSKSARACFINPVSTLDDTWIGVSSNWVPPFAGDGNTLRDQPAIGFNDLAFHVFKLEPAVCQ